MFLKVCLLIGIIRFFQFLFQILEFIGDFLNTNRIIWIFNRLVLFRRQFIAHRIAQMGNIPSNKFLGNILIFRRIMNRQHFDLGVHSLFPICVQCRRKHHNHPMGIVVAYAEALTIRRENRHPPLVMLFRKKFRVSRNAHQHISKNIGFERELPTLIRILDNVVLHHSSDQRFHAVLLDIGQGIIGVPAGIVVQPDCNFLKQFIVVRRIFAEFQLVPHGFIHRPRIDVDCNRRCQQFFAAINHILNFLIKRLRPITKLPVLHGCQGCRVVQRRKIAGGSQRKHINGVIAGQGGILRRLRALQNRNIWIIQ